MDLTKDHKNIAQIPTTSPTKQKVNPLPEELWVSDLAQNEKSMLMDDTINIRDEKQLRDTEVRIQTESFMLMLRARCARLVEIFNQNKGAESTGVKMFKIAGSKLDFMLFRNTLKLVFSTPKEGVVDVYFSSYLESSKNAEENPYVSGERLELTFGPFDEPYWALKGERIHIESMLRKFITDFVLLSCR